MALQTPPDTAKTYRVVAAMNTHDAMTLVDPQTNETVHIVGYEETGLKRELAALSVGETTTPQLERAGVRANVWYARRPETTTLAA